MGDEIRGPRIHRPAASAHWEYEHHWGKSFGDSTTLHVRRTVDGPLTISYGEESIEIRADLVAQVARMVAAAAAWQDEQESDR